MEFNRHDPGAGAAVAHRPELYRELRRRNERCARVADRLEARRDRELRIARVVQEHRARRFRQAG
jgi:hypothetical protein